MKLFKTNATIDVAPQEDGFKILTAEQINLYFEEKLAALVQTLRIYEHVSLGFANDYNYFIRRIK